MKLNTLKFAALLMMWPMSALATPLLSVNDAGQLTGATGIDVGGNLYDVSFVGDGNCTEQFDGCDSTTDFVFQNSTDAEAASIALLEQVLLDAFDSNPELTLGCSNINGCFVVTPYATNGESFYLAFARNLAADFDDSYSTHRSLSVTHSLGNSATWANWTLADLNGRVLLVSEPGTLALLGLGLGLAGIRARRRK